jgi:hypothetical protein
LSFWRMNGKFISNDIEIISLAHKKSLKCHQMLAILCFMCTIITAFYFFCTKIKISDEKVGVVYANLFAGIKRIAKGWGQVTRG